MSAGSHTEPGGYTGQAVGDLRKERGEARMRLGRAAVPLLSFVVLAVSIHQAAAPERKVWSQVAVAFATAYATLVSLVYFVQLTWVGPRLARGQVEGIEVFLFAPFDSFLYAVDILGYSFMSAATLFAARVFTGDGLQRWARRFLTANGLLIPFLALQLYIHPLIWIASLWAITFPGAMWMLARVFRRSATH